MSKNKTDIKELLNEASQSLNDVEPRNKNLLEVRLLRANLSLAKETLNKLRSDFRYNISYVAFGALLTFILTISSSLILLEYKQSESTELKKSIIEQKLILIQIQNDYHKVSLDIISLKKEIDSLKVQ